MERAPRAGGRAVSARGAPVEWVTCGGAVACQRNERIEKNERTGAMKKSEVSRMYVLASALIAALAVLPWILPNCAPFEVAAKTAEPVIVALGADTCEELAKDAAVDPLVVDLVCLASEGSRFLVRAPRAEWMQIRASRVSVRDAGAP